MKSLDKYKLSMFNIIKEDKNKNLLITNTLTNALIRIINNTNELIDFNLNNLLSLYNKHIDLFIKTGILVPDNVNEQLLIDEIYQKNVLKNERLDIIILTTNRCNFSCAYCFQKRETYTLDSKQYDGILNFIETKIKENGYKNIKIRWFGGEPLLDKKGMIYFLNKMKSLSQTYKVSYGCGIISNGYLLDINTFKILFKHKVINYQITVDGLPDINYRFLNNGKSTFNTIFNNLKRIRDEIKYSMFSITIRINFTRDLLNRVDEVIDLFFKEFGKDRRFGFSFIPVFDWSYKDSDFMKAKQIQSQLITEEEIVEVMKKSVNKLDFKAWSNLKFANNECWAGTPHGYTIDANGDILKCDFKLEGFDANVVGHIDLEGNVFLDNKKEKKWIFNTPLIECYSCGYFPLCLSTSCGAAKLDGIMKNKCNSFKHRVLDYLEIESYSLNNNFIEVKNE
ncbi:MAG: radical SAM protein [Bacilli bacterium]